MPGEVVLCGASRPRVPCRVCGGAHWRAERPGDPPALHHACSHCDERGHARSVCGACGEALPLCGCFGTMRQEVRA